jgi:hypothetical protein
MIETIDAEELVRAKIDLDEIEEGSPAEELWWFLEDGDLVGLQVPLIPDLDTRILRGIEAEPNSFYMGSWHGWQDDQMILCNSRQPKLEDCGTTHCRAGWASVIAARAGYDLEGISRENRPNYAVTTSIVGSLLYLAAGKEIPSFHAETDEALEDIRQGAKQEQERGVVTC